MKNAILLTLSSNKMLLYLAFILLMGKLSLTDVDTEKNVNMKNDFLSKEGMVDNSHWDVKHLTM